MFDTILASAGSLFDGLFSSTQQNLPDAPGAGGLAPDFSSPAPEAGGLAAAAGLFDFWGESEKPEVARGGLAGLAGHLGQQIDRAQLATLLEVRGEGAAGDKPSSPNSVSAEEFEKLAAMYTAIRRGETHLKIDSGELDPEAAAAFQSGVMGDIGKLLQTESGRQLVSSLASDPNRASGQHFDTTIRAPEVGRSPHEDDHVPQSTRAPGVGTDTAVLYRPGETLTERGPDGELVQTSDTILFHEMVHAYHDRQGSTPTQHDGMYHAVPVVDHPVHHFDSQTLQSEYQAVGLDGKGEGRLTENAYRAERARLGEQVAQRPRYAIEDPLAKLGQ